MFGSSSARPPGDGRLGEQEDGGRLWEPQSKGKGTFSGEFVEFACD